MSISIRCSRMLLATLKTYSTGKNIKFSKHSVATIEEFRDAVDFNAGEEADTAFGAQFLVF